MLVWLKRLNDALERFNPLFIIPLLQCSFIFFAIVSGGIFFKEFNAFDTNQWVGFWFGIATMFGGLSLLTPQPVSSEDEKLQRDLVNLILEQRGSSFSGIQHSTDGQTSPNQESIITPRARTNSTESSHSKEKDKTKGNSSTEKSPFRSPRFSKENMTKTALEVVRDVMNESAMLLQGAPSTRVLSHAMVSATIDVDERRRRRKSLETLLFKIRETPISTNGYSSEIMGLIEDLNLTEVVQLSPPSSERDIKRHLTMTQEKLRNKIETELQESITPRELQTEQPEPIRDLSLRFNEIT